MALAARSLGDRPGHWGHAMCAELEAAIDDGRPLAFATGCLLASWRELPSHPEGRHTLAAHLLTIGVIVPTGALLLWCGLLGYPYLSFGRVGIWGFLAGHSEQISLMNDGDWAVAPALALLVFAQALSQLGLAWFVLKRDWERVAAIGWFNAATLTTLAIVTSLLPLMRGSILLQVAGLIVEMLAVLALARWHQRRCSHLFRPAGMAR